MNGTAFALQLQPSLETKTMDYIIIEKTTNVLKDPSEEAIKDITNALASDKKYIILNFDATFIYNSTIISLALINKDRIVIIENGNERFKVMAKILKIESLLCVVKSLDEFLDKCAKSGLKNCKNCRKN